MWSGRCFNQLTRSSWVEVNKQIDSDDLQLTRTSSVLWTTSDTDCT